MAGDPSPHALRADPPRSDAAGATEVFRPRVLGWGVGLLLLPLLAGAYLLLAPRPPLPEWAGAAVIGLDLLLTGVIIGKRSRNSVELSPRGLRVTHDRGTDQAEWADVRTAERVRTDENERLVLVTRAGARIVVDLEGYADREKAAVWQRVRGYTST